MGCCSSSSKAVATRAGMCATCPHASRLVTLHVCTLDGKDCTDHAIKGKCPRGRYPDRDGLVRWLGVRWVGMPAPLRWRFEARYGRAPRVDGCGCVASVKRFWIDGEPDPDGMPNGRWDAAGLIVAVLGAFWWKPLSSTKR